MGCECAVTSDHRLKIILQDGTEIRDLYKLAGRSQVQIRRLTFKRDSLEDIFLKAMENGAAELPLPMGEGRGERVSGITTE